MPRRADTMLTDKAVKNLRPGEKRYEVRDAARPGFGVRVELDGRKVFFQRFGTRGERRLNLGTYSASYGLAKARADADKARAEFACEGSPKSIDPALEERRGTRDRCERFTSRSRGKRITFKDERPKFPPQGFGDRLRPVHAALILPQSGNLDRSVDETLDLSSRHRTGRASRLATVFEDGHRWNRSNAVSLAEFRQRIRIDLDDDESTSARRGDFRDFRSDHSTRSAPRRPEIDDDGNALRSFDNLLLECGCGDVHARHCTARPALGRGRGGEVLASYTA